MGSSEQDTLTEQIVSAVRVLERLGFDYRLSGPQRKKSGGNQYHRRISITTNDGPVTFYPHATGRTWAQSKGHPIPEIKSLRGLETYLKRVHKSDKPRAVK